MQRKFEVQWSTLLSAKITTRVRNPLIKNMGKMLWLYTKHETKKKGSLSKL